jgi:hypothetical protein
VTGRAERPRQGDGGEAFGDIERAGQQAPEQTDVLYRVHAADVAAADGPQVEALAPAGDELREGDGAEQVAEGEGSERGHERITPQMAADGYGQTGREGRGAGRGKAGRCEGSKRETSKVFKTFEVIVQQKPPVLATGGWW